MSKESTGGYCQYLILRIRAATAWGPMGLHFVQTRTPIERTLRIGFQNWNSLHSGRDVLGGSR